MEQPLKPGELNDLVNQFAAALEDPNISMEDAQDIEEALGILQSNYSGDVPLVAGDQRLEERSPDISFEERALLKNLGATDGQRKAAQLRAKRPDLEVGVDKDTGELVARKAGSQDPFTFMDPPSLDPEDITDLAYDIPSGVVQGAATAAGAAAGSLASPVVGTAVGAGAGAAGSSATMEALRQYLGEKMGLPDNTSGTDIGIAAAAGPLSLAAFGVPRTAVSAPLRGVLGLARDGLVKGGKVVGKSMLKAASQVPAESIETALRSMPLIDRINALNSRVKERLANKSSRYILKQAEANRDRAFDQLEAGRQNFDSLVNQANGRPSSQLSLFPDEAPRMTVDTTRAKQTFADRIARLRRNSQTIAGPGSRNAVDEAEVANLQGVLDRAFANEKPTGFGNSVQVSIPDQATPRQAQSLLERLAAITQWGPEATPTDHAKRDAVTALEESFTRAGLPIPKDRQYHAAAQGLDKLKTNLDAGPDAAAKFIRKIGGNQEAEELLEQAGVDASSPMMRGTGQLFRAAKDFNPRNAGYGGSRVGLKSIRLSPRSTKRLIDALPGSDSKLSVLNRAAVKSMPGLWNQLTLKELMQMNTDTTSESPTLRTGE